MHLDRVTFKQSEEIGLDMNVENIFVEMFLKH